MRRVRDDDLLLFPLLGQAQDWINMYVCVLVQLRERNGKEKEIEKRGERKGCWESRKSRKEKGNRKIKKEKQKNLLCGLNVGEIEVDFGYL